MARYIEQGKSIFIPFHNGVSITDSQLHLRMYKTEEMFKRYGYACGEVDVLCEYAPVVRCKDCKHCTPDENIIGGYGDCNRFERDNDNSIVCEDDFCSYGERRGGE